MWILLTCIWTGTNDESIRSRGSEVGTFRAQSIFYGWVWARFSIPDRTPILCELPLTYSSSGGKSIRHRRHTARRGSTISECNQCSCLTLDPGVSATNLFSSFSETSAYQSRGSSREALEFVAACCVSSGWEHKKGTTKLQRRMETWHTIQKRSLQLFWIVGTKRRSLKLQQ